VGHHGPYVWIGFTALIAALLFLDLAVIHRRSHRPSAGEAARWSLVVISIALAFGLFIYWREGSISALEYYTGYIIELSLSVDNLFVFLLVFQFFNLLDDLTVVDNVMLPAQLAGMARAAADRRASELLGALGIDGHARAYPGRLSGGERQRVAVARALS
jgi:ABC-type dipeptide/oligopeptide/nickel transport system ATPase component